MGALPEIISFGEELLWIANGPSKETRTLVLSCKREVYFFVGTVKSLCSDQRNLQNERQNPIPLSKNDTHKTLERAKLLD